MCAVTALPNNLDIFGGPKNCIYFFNISGCYDGHVYILDAHTGDIYWQYQTGSEVKSSPTVDMATGFVYVGSHSQHVYALNIKVCETLYILETFFGRDRVRGQEFTDQWHGPGFVYKCAYNMLGLSYRCILKQYIYH